MRGNAKPFGKQLSPCAKITNHSGNDFRHARKLQTIRETTFAMRGNIKPFGKRLSTYAENLNYSGNFHNVHINKVVFKCYKFPQILRFFVTVIIGAG